MVKMKTGIKELDELVGDEIGLGLRDILHISSGIEETVFCARATVLSYWKYSSFGFG